MKLSKKKEQEIMQVYDTWLHSYLNGDVKTYDSFLDVDYRFIGSTNNEEFLNKKDTTNFFKATADQLAGKTEIRNSIKTLEQIDGLVLITDLFDAYFLNGDDWAYYGRFRFTSAMRKNKNGWRFIYQHFSTPDTKAQEGETLGTEQISKENQELRDAIKRRTVELEQKNRELQIEASLEKVRSRSMAMHKTEEILEVVVVLFNQLRNLNIDFIQAWISIWYLDQGYLELWMSPIEGFGDLPIYHKRPSAEFEDTTIKSWKKGERFSYLSLKGGDTVTAFLQDMDRMLESDYFRRLQKLNQYDRLEFVDANHKFGTVSMSWHEDVPEQNKEILYRFAKVFEQTYTRFLDLKKAEVQTREAQIEASLERVRSASMAIHKSEELHKVVLTVAQEINSLGLNIDAAHLFRFEEGNDKGLNMWIAGDGGIYPYEVYFPYIKHEIFDGIHKARTTHKNFFSISGVSKKEKNRVYRHLIKSTKIKIPESRQKYALEAKSAAYSVALAKHSGIAIIQFSEEGAGFSVEENEILSRFSKVFEQAYIRFLGMAKAEKQAREAMIEAALERIRARAMAMHSSDELNDVLSVLFDQFDILGINPVWAHLSLIDLKNNTFTYRMTGRSGKRSLTKQVIDLNAREEWKESLENFKKGKPNSVSSVEYKPEALPQIWELFDETLSALPEEGKVYPEDFPDGLFNTQGYCKFGYIGFNHNRKATEEEKLIVARFATEFGRIYQRYLDIEKAEAQAREAQIEAALERIRARSMAMHSSEELNDVLSVMFQQIEVLGIDAKSTHLTLMDVENNKFSFRISGKSGAANIGEQIIDLDAMPTWQETVANWKKAKPHSHQCLVYPPEILPDLWKLIDKSLKSLPAKERIKIKDFPNGVFDCEGHTKFGYIGFNNSRPPTEEEISIVIRFAREFERVYQRFLDIEKAEAQAREAQIEGALERVRTRTMAMHKSDELLEAGALLYKELSQLGIEYLTTGYTLFDKKAKIGWSYGVNPADGNIRHQPVGMPHTETKVMKAIVKSWQKQKPLLVLELNEKETILHQTFIAEKSTNFPISVKQLLAISPKQLKIHVFNFKQGYLLIVGGTLLTAEQQQMTTRFAKVFEQTYTRFLDLQKAEAHAWEAYIEAALERVRTRTMAMHKSEELAETALVLYKQFSLLGNIPDRMSIGIFKEETKEIELWSTDQSGSQLNQKFTGSFEKSAEYTKIYEAWKADNDSFVLDLSGQKLKTWLKFIREELKLFVDDSNIKGRRVQQAAFFSHGFLLFTTNEPITDEIMQLLIRFAGVFSQTYTRFLDLQKAEAQARESQIQLSLERVRARSLAMQSSDELHEVLGVLFRQFDDLDIQPVNVFLSLFDREERTLTYRASGKSGKRIPAKQVVNVDSMEALQALYDKWLVDNSDTVEVIYYPKEVLPQLFGIFAETFSSMPKRDRIGPHDFPEGGYSMAGYTPFGYLGYDHQRQATDEEKEILTRFCVEFTRVYQRFLDLQKAEAQTREAQIEATLERVRSASMAMHQSKDLHNVLVMLYNQLDALGLKMHSAQIIESIDDFKEMHCWIVTNGVVYPEQVHAPFSKNIFFKRFREAVTNGESFYTLKFSKRQKDNLFHHFFDNTILRNAPQARKDLILSSPGLGTSNAMGKYTSLSIMRYDGILYSEEENEIIKRFGKVLEQSYTRFLDIKKAEAQAREAQIEAALEKVRSQSLAMHATSEMQQVANAVYDQLKELGLEMEAVGMSGAIAAKQDYDVWVGGVPFGKALRIPYNENTKVQRDYNKMLEERPELFAKTYSGKDKEEYINHLLTHGDFPKALKKKMKTSETFTTSIALAKKSSIQILRYTNQPYSEEDNEILKRFSKVFEQAYIRFMDLQKAEAQARESKIEMALEKVRSRTMAMHKSEELGEVAAVLFEQISSLTYAPERFNIAIGNKEEESFDIWVTDQKGHEVSKRFMFQVDKSPVVREVFNAWEKEPYIVQDLHGKKLQEWVRYMQEEIGLPFDKARLSEHRYINSVFFSHGCIGITTNEPPETKTLELIERFAKVFQQTYVRFLDLQKAEVQAREAQIEVALERVRSRAMAMHHTDELTDVLGVLFNQFDFLGINPVLTHLTLFDEDNETFTLRITTGGEKRTIAEQLIDVNAVESWKTSFANWKKSKMHAIDCIDYPPEILPFVWELMEEVMSALPEGQKIYPSDFPDGLYTTQGHCKYGYIGFNHTRRATEEEKEIVVRFAKEFARLYQRFLDIQKAEAQVREAQIEGALERVRSKTMAMHNSEDLEDIVVSLFDEVMNLGLDKSLRCGIGILEGHEGMETRSVNSNSDGTVDLRVGMLNMTIHPMLVGLKKAWENGKKRYSYEYTGKDVRKYYEALNNEPEYPFNADLKTLPKREFHRSFFYSSGIIFAFSENPISEESSKILARFAAVFGQTYRRFLDLQKAEERAKDAIKQASLDRVRGQIASMRSAKDLERITPLVWNELTTLSIPFIRCGVFIINESSEKVQVHLSAPDGHSLGVMLMPFDADPLTTNFVANWRKGEVFRAHWNREQFIAFMQTMIDLDQIKNKKVYQGAEQPPESLHLHFVPFTQGMLYVGSEATLTEEQIKLVQSLADAFAIAYARYEDFDKLEKAKERVEVTLSELKATQNQLVQSEKMASLGELTAGIAHEIQNPLNFVNNFSEVSNELIDEMNEEIAKGDLDEAKAIASDIKQNLEKINHHGRRADAIVKGMLQHSRSSSGVKEPTDINALADEYLRLAYHGLRAKDKSFNAKLETDYEESIGKIEIITQDIGRVILNLITNAFYATNEKTKNNQTGYEPKVTITTKKEKNQVFISVKDNGNGIPQKVLDKIFQPFFTTKPTGQGTGLGLSLSYDIVKAHGGELKVKTRENEGTEFKVILPI